MALSATTAPARHWTRTSPIPTDPTYFGACSTRSEAGQAGVNRLKRTSSGPIPTDPVYTARDFYEESVLKPRIKSEALQIARLHQGGALAQLFNPGFKVIPIGARPGKIR